MAERVSQWQSRDEGYWRELWHAGEVRFFDTIASTNDVAAELAAAGAPHFSIVVAEQQTRGRGRGGASWSAQPGTSLLFSVLLRVNQPAAAPGCVPVRIGLTVAEAIGDARVKWPNDVVIPGHGKVAGILCEGVFGSHIVAGVGINVLQEREAFAPELTGRACSIWSATGVGRERALLLTQVLAALHDMGAGITQPLTDAELARLATRDILRNRDVVIDADGRTQKGVARGVSADGALLIDSAATMGRVYNGTVRLADAHAYPGSVEGA
ncbi:MAG: biotin--[acetyl-CoA-carboxylase] ligase [Gemmatimonadota bacterium]